MPEQAIAGDAVAHKCEPITIEEQGSGFHAVLAGAAGRVLVTNDVGCLVLDLCDGKRTGDEIVSAVVDRFADVPNERITEDVTTFLTQATQKEVLTWSK